MSLLTQLPEDFLHHIWRTCNFQLRDLSTLEGASLYIRNPGTWNHNQGPDFLDARLQIDGIEWHGQVELHVHSQDWFKHGHHLDPLYNNTILHVCLSSHGKPIFREDGTSIPELVLQDRIDPSLMHRYKQLQLEEASLPCQSHLDRVEEKTIQKTLSSVAVERSMDKVAKISARLQQNVQDWEQMLWEEILSMLGGPVNREVFRELAQRVPIQKLRKQQDKQEDLEALLFGAAGMLGGKRKNDAYFTDLQERWTFLKEKLHLEMPYPLAIRFMRMRPASFPTIRLSQSAALLRKYPLLSNLLQVDDLATFTKAPIQASAYWNNHYRFFENSKHSPKKLGRQQKIALIINSLLPISLIYHQAHSTLVPSSFLADILSQLPKEHNKITRIYEALGWKNAHALASQGMIGLSKKYCQARRCLHCGIGKEILA